MIIMWRQLYDCLVTVRDNYLNVAKVTATTVEYKRQSLYNLYYKVTQVNQVYHVNQLFQVKHVSQMYQVGQVNQVYQVNQEYKVNH